jgi:Family of unknown function (DUF6111)
MIRAFVDEFLLFLLPFAAFAAYLLARKRNPLAWASWSDHTAWLVISGLAVVILTLLVTGLTADRQQGAFRPTHTENGRVVPGQFR